LRAANSAGGPTWKRASDWHLPAARRCWPGALAPRDGGREFVV